MVYCLKVNIVTNDQAIIDDIKAKVKAKANAKLWQGDIQWRKDTYTNLNSRLVLFGVVRYLNEVDMDATLNWMKSKSATYKPSLMGPEGDEMGSFVEAHTCDHRAKAGGCTITYRWDK